MSRRVLFPRARLLALVASVMSAMLAVPGAALKDALAAAQRVSDTSKSHDKTQVSAALADLAASMRALNALFPAALRAEPGTVDPPWMQHNGSATSPKQ